MGVRDIQKKVRACVAKMPQRDNVRKISLFGSHLRGNAKEDSDIDLLLELVEPVGYFELSRMQNAFEKSLGKKVDLVTPKALSKYFREQVIKEAKKVYER